MLNRLYSWYGKRVVIGAAVIIVLLVAAGIALQILKPGTEEEVQNGGRLVTVATVASLQGSGVVEAIGVVESINEARLEAEASGRVTSVRVTLGDRIAAGQVLVTLENSRESAALLQAEGAYEAAVAAATASGVSVTSAETTQSAAYNGAKSTLRASYIAIDSLTTTFIDDDLFSHPAPGIYGFRISNTPNTTSLIQMRKELEERLASWASRRSAGYDTNAAIDSGLAAARNDITFMLSFLEAINAAVASKQTTGRAEEAEKSSILGEIASARTATNQTQQSIEAATTNVQSANESLARAKLVGESGTGSAADAQVKQALGSLRAAQANFNKTVITSPISGRLNSLSVKTGDYVSTFTPIAVVANNDALRITTYISSSERERVAVGNSVTIGEVTGVVTAIAPAVDSLTKKIEVHIAAESSVLENGETVRVVIEASDTSNLVDSIRIPVSALKVETDRVVVFTAPAGTLVAHEVETGALIGEDIIILSGLTTDMKIVLDGRGLNEGDVVDTAE